jgi:uncharacterized delta-60 repeat protein
MNTIRYLGAFLPCAISTLLLTAPRVHAAPGDLDTLNLVIHNTTGTATVNTTVAQSDGKVFIGGAFNLVNGAGTRCGDLRVSTNDTIDLSFQNYYTSPSPFNSAVVRRDGDIFCIVVVTPYVTELALNPNGSYSTNPFPCNADFTLPNNNVWCTALQVDGKILVGGDFTTYHGLSCNRMIRLNFDRTIDVSFTPNVNGTVDCVAVQTDGRILIGGNFTAVGGVARNRMARLNTDGTLDTSFVDPNVNGVVNCIAVQANGSIVIGGNFTTVGGIARNHIARISAAGAVGTVFDPNVNDTINSLVVQTDGKLLLGGNFTTVGGVTRNHIARLNMNGTLDTGFDPNANGIVYSVGLRADGMVMVGGAFTALQPNGAATSTARTGVARLLNDAATQTVSVPDNSHIVWTRGGAGPELSWATFELSTDGGTTWGAPIVATRVGTNWQANGSIFLPASGQIRARGAAISGLRNSSSGIIEQVASFSGLINAPAAVVAGNGVSIPNGDTTPGTTDGTEFWAAFGATTAVHTFTITNTGTATLNLTGTPKVVVSGTNAADFVVTLQPTSPIAANYGTTTFQVTFTPGDVGVRNATLSIANDDANQNPFNFSLLGRGLSFTNDTDGDGLSDASELMGASLGFDWQVSQPALVQAYNTMANGAGLFTASQVQALNIGKPLISHDPNTGQFKLTLGLTKTTTLSPTNWVPLPFSAGSTSINGQGNLEFLFTAPDNTAFFRLQAD